MSCKLRRALAEALGTFSLVFAGCGAIVVNEQTGALGHLGIAAAFGTVVLTMVLTLGHISGAHINPAVTLAFRSLKRIPTGETAAYIVAQLFGAALAAGLLASLFPDAAAATAVGATLPSGSALQSLVLETLLTATLMFVIIGVATDERAQGQLAAIAIGGFVFLGALWGGPISGASMNPARSFGPALAAGNWTDHWLYWLGPIAGAILGAWAYEILRPVDNPSAQD